MDTPKMAFTEHERSESSFILFFRYLTTNFYKLIGLNLFFFLITLVVYIWFTTQINIIAAEHELGIPCMMAAVITYYLDWVPHPVSVILFFLSALIWGPSCAGLTHVTYRLAIGEHVWTFSDFIQAARKNWRQAVPIGLLDVVVGYSSLTYFFSSSFSQIPGIFFLRIFWCMLLVGYLCYRTYIFVLIVTVDLPLSALIKDAFLLGAISPWRTLAVLVVTISLAILSGYIDFILLPFFAYSFLSYFCCAVTAPLIHKHFR